MKLSKTQKRVSVIWFLVLLLVSIAAYFIVWAPLNQELNNKEQTLSFEKQKNDALKEQIENGEKEAVPVTSIRASMPAMMEEEELIRMINRASESSRVVVQNYQYGEQTSASLSEDSSIELEQLTMSINGDADSVSYLNRFVRELESADRFINIQSFNYQDRGDTVSFQLEFHVYAKSFDE